MFECNFSVVSGAFLTAGGAKRSDDAHKKPLRYIHNALACNRPYPAPAAPRS